MTALHSAFHYATCKQWENLSSPPLLPFSNLPRMIASTKRNISGAMGWVRGLAGENLFFILFYLYFLIQTICLSCAQTSLLILISVLEIKLTRGGRLFGLQPLIAGMQ